MTRLRTLSAVAIASLVLGACTVGPDYHRPALQLPDAYHATQTPSSRPLVTLEAWWRGFDDPELVRVVERAASENLDVAQSIARVRQARAIARAAGAALLPQGIVQASAAGIEQSLDSPVGAIGRHLPGFSRGIDDYTLGASMSWDIDLAGGQRRVREAARAGALSAQDQACATRTAIEAETADAYLQVRAYQLRLELAHRQLQVQQDLLALVRRRADEGIVADREVQQADASLQAVQASMAPLSAGLQIQLDRLDVLMGAAPGTFRSEIGDAARLPRPPGIAADLRPGDLLHRRPDLLAIEQQLVAANAQIGAVLADYYPKLSLTGLLGIDSISGAAFFSGDAVQTQIAGGLSWRLFDFGRLDAQVEQARGREAEMLGAYRAAVLRATQEVESSLWALRQDEAEATALSHQVEDLTRARGQTAAAYEGGVASLLEVRDLDRDLLAASGQLIQARVAADRDTVALFRGLGGGWKAAGQ